MKIQEQLDELFSLERDLNVLLNEQQYEQFQQQQYFFTDKIRKLLESNSAEHLNKVVNELETLRSGIGALQIKANLDCKLLKDKSLLQKRNKSKIKAYKNSK